MASPEIALTSSKGVLGGACTAFHSVPTTDHVVEMKLSLLASAASSVLMLPSHRKQALQYLPPTSTSNYLRLLLPTEYEAKRRFRVHSNAQYLRADPSPQRATYPTSTEQIVFDGDRHSGLFAAATKGRLRSSSSSELDYGPKTLQKRAPALDIDLNLPAEEDQASRSPTANESDGHSSGVANEEDERSRLLRRKRQATHRYISQADKRAAKRVRDRLQYQQDPGRRERIRAAKAQRDARGLEEQEKDPALRLAAQQAKLVALGRRRERYRTNAAVRERRISQSRQYRLKQKEQKEVLRLN